MSKPFQDWSHRKFVEDLADAKNNTLIEVPLGGVYKNNHKLPRADVVEINPSYTNFYITIYEVKQRRSDILKSIRTGKWERYLPHCHRFYFACRKGIVQRGEVPEGLGLALRNENGWYTLRAGDIRKDHRVPRETLLAYLFQRVKYMNSLNRRSKIASHYRIRKELKQAGEDVAQAIDFHQDFGWAIERALDKGFGRYELTDFIQKMSEVDDKVTEALEFKRKYGTIIERLEKETDSHYGAKGVIRNAVRNIQKERRNDD